VRGERTDGIVTPALTYHNSEKIAKDCPAGRRKEVGQRLEAANGTSEDLHVVRNPVPNLGQNFFQRLFDLVITTRPGNGHNDPPTPFCWEAKMGVTRRLAMLTTSLADRPSGLVVRQVARGGAISEVPLLGHVFKLRRLVGRSGGNFAGIHTPADVLWEPENCQRPTDAGSGHAELLGSLLAVPAVEFHKRRVAPCFFYWLEIIPEKVLD
jgi:hypothetical protein